METILGWKELLYLGSMLIGFLIGLLLIIFGVKKNKANVLIGMAYIFITWAVFTAYLSYSGLFVHFPQFYRTGNLIAYLFAPFTYLYIRQVVEDRPITRRDFYHFIPFILYFFDFFPVFFLTTLEEKRLLIQSEINDLMLFAFHSQSRFFPPGFYAALRTGLIVIYWFFSIRILYSLDKKAENTKQTFGKEWGLWMKIFVYCELILFVPYILLYRFVDSALGYDLTHIPGPLVILVGGIAILFFPKVLYGLNEYGYILAEENLKPKQDFQDYLTPEKEMQIREQLDQVFEKGKKHLQKGYTVNDLAKDTSIPPYLISLYINRKLETNFSNLINQQRIEECCQMMKSGKYAHLTLEGLAELCGFNNRNSFSAAFKKFKRVTPSQFLKSKFEANNLDI